MSEEGRMVGHLVRAMREAHGLSQEDLSELTGITQTYISRIERGDVGFPTDRLLKKLGDALGIARPDFFLAAAGEDRRAGATPRRFYEPGDVRANYTPAEVAKIVQHVEARPGENYRERLAAQRAELSRDEYEQLCVDMFEAWGKNADLALSVAERSRP